MREQSHGRALTDGKPSPGRPGDLAPAAATRDAPRYGSQARRSSSVGSSNTIRRRRRRPAGAKPKSITREEHERRFRELLAETPSPHTGASSTQFSQRACDTSYALLRAEIIRARGCKSLVWQTTNAQQAIAIKREGRGRCSRTVQRHLRTLERMGLLTVTHVRRGRATPGYRDCLRLRLVQGFVTPSKLGEREEEPSATTLSFPGQTATEIAPAAPARPDPPPLAAVNGSDEDQEVDTRSPEQVQADDEWAEMVLRRFSDPPEVQEARREQRERERTARMRSRWRDD